MVYLCDDGLVCIIKHLIYTISRHLDNVSNIYNLYFEVMVSHSYPSELQLNRASAADTGLIFGYKSISNGVVHPKLKKTVMSDFDIGNFQFLDGKLPSRTSY